MKKYWHTKTLFIQTWNWKYKWSYKHEHCIKCWTCNFKHKWRWLCTRCWDKERDKKTSRKLIKKKASENYYDKHLRRNFKKDIQYFKFRIYNLISRKKEKKKEWIEKNKEAILLKGKVYRRLQKWLTCMQVIINWKTRYLPFETLEKPNKFCNDLQKNIWKQNMRDFEILKKYYKNK